MTWIQPRTNPVATPNQPGPAHSPSQQIPPSQSELADGSACEPVENAAPLSECTLHLNAEALHLPTVVARVHEVARQLVAWLGIEGIELSQFPQVEVDHPYKTSFYDSATNTIGLLSSEVSDGFVIGEEVAHWLQDQTLLLRSIDRNAPLDWPEHAEENWHEFFGYLGRELARIACADTTLAGLFQEDSDYAPKTGANFRMAYARERRAVHLIEFRRLHRGALSNRLESLSHLCSAEEKEFAQRVAELMEISYEERDNVLWPVQEASRQRIAKAIDEVIHSEAPNDSATLDYLSSHGEDLRQALADQLGVDSENALEDLNRTLWECALRPLKQLREDFPLFFNAEQTTSNDDATSSIGISAMPKDYGIYRVKTMALSCRLDMLIVQSARDQYEETPSIKSFYDHWVGYRLASLWLELTPDIRQAAARLFFLSPQEFMQEWDQVFSHWIDMQGEW